MRQEVEVLLESLNWDNFLLCEVIVLKLFDLVLSILHPQNSISIKIEGNCNLRHPKLTVKLYLVFVCIDLVHVFVLYFQLNSWVNLLLHRAYRFWVGNAQNITIFTPYIIVIECEQTIFEWLLKTLSISSFSGSLPKSLILMCLSPIAM